MVMHPSSVRADAGVQRASGTRHRGGHPPPPTRAELSVDFKVS